MQLTSVPVLVAVVAGAVLLTGAARAQDRTDWPEGLTLGTAAEDSPYQAYGSALAALVGETLGIEMAVQPTGGAYQNAALMQTGDLDFGLLAMGPARDAWVGDSPLTPALPHDQLRALFPMYRTAFHIISTNREEMTSTAALEGTTVGTGPAGEASGIYIPRFFDTLEIGVEVRNGHNGDLAEQLEQGLIAALALADGAPIDLFAEIAATADAAIFSFTTEQQATLLDAYPALVPVTIPEGTYDDQDGEIQTVAMWHFAVARADLPESLVYEITKKVMEHRDWLLEAHPGAAGTDAANIVQNSFLPFHPGAVRYYEEIGLEIPEELKAW